MSQEVRDKLAVDQGWTKNDAGYWVTPGGTELPMGGDWHPIMDDLNTCTAMWDEYAGKHGYRFGLCPWLDTWHANHSNGFSFIKVTATGTDAAAELRDRWALLGEVLKARGV